MAGSNPEARRYDPQVAADVIALVASAVRGETPPQVSSDVDALLDFGVFHSLGAAVAMALAASGAKGERITRFIDTACRNALLFRYEAERVERRLQENGIWYLPLKGALLAERYPRFGMREMADRDILIDAARAADVRTIMEDLGYATEQFGKTHHDVYLKAPVLNFEMHTTLFEPGTLHADYYADVRARLLPGEGCRLRFSDEDFYLFLVAHEHKHFSGGGTGLRSLVDTYVCLREAELDWDYVRAEAEALGIAGFEERNRALAFAVMEGRELSPAQRDMLDFILGSGTYGDADTALRNGIRRGGRTGIAYVLHRLAVPVRRDDPAYDGFAEEYPLFYRWKALLPLLPLYRVARSIAEGRFLREAKALRAVERDKARPAN